MQIILLDKVVNLGALGDVVKVKDGYARNFLIPSGRARRATQSAIAEFEAQLGGAEALQAAYLDSNVPAEAIEGQVQLSLQVQELGSTLAPDADPNGQQQAVADAQRDAAELAGEALVAAANADLVTGRKSFQPAAEVHVEVEKI